MEFKFLLTLRVTVVSKKVKVNVVRSQKFHVVSHHNLTFLRKNKEHSDRNLKLQALANDTVR